MNSIWKTLSVEKPYRFLPMIYKELKHYAVMQTIMSRTIENYFTGLMPGIFISFAIADV